MADSSETGEVWLSGGPPGSCTSDRFRWVAMSRLAASASLPRYACSNSSLMRVHHLSRLGAHWEGLVAGDSAADASSSRIRQRWNIGFERWPDQCSPQHVQLQVCAIDNFLVVVMSHDSILGPHTAWRDTVQGVRCEVAAALPRT